MTDEATIDEQLARLLARVDAGIATELRQLLAARLAAPADAERRLRLAQDAGGIGTYETDMVSGVIHGTPRTYALLGLEPARGPLAVAEWWKIIHPEDRDWLRAWLVERLRRPGDDAATEYRIVADGETRWLSSCDRIASDGAGRAVRVFGAVQDITRRKLDEQRAVLAERRLRQAQEAGRIGTYQIDLASGLTTGTPRFYEIFGMPGDTAVMHREDWQRAIHPLDRADLENRLREILRHGEIDNVIEYRIVVDGETRWINSCDRVERAADGRATVAYGAVQDITERKAADERIWRAAHHDLLTGLPNRLLFAQRLAALVEAARAGGGRIGLLMIDLDCLKAANDRHGHRAGDHLLRAAADRLAVAAPPGAVVARLGGDEFALVLPIGAPEALTALGSQLLVSLHRPLEYGELWLDCGASIGAAVFPEDARDNEGLLHAADLALCTVKLTGRGRYRPFTPTLQADLARLGRRRRIALAA